MIQISKSDICIFVDEVANIINDRIRMYTINIKNKKTKKKKQK
jgi:hypothetical protein